MSKYEPKMQDRVRVAWGQGKDAVFVGVTGIVCGIDSLAVHVQLDNPFQGMDIYRFPILDFRLEKL